MHRAIAILAAELIAGLTLTSQHDLGGSINGCAKEFESMEKRYDTMQITGRFCVRLSGISRPQVGT